MTRTIVLSAPSQQLTQVVGHSAGRWIYSPAQPVWEDLDMRRKEAAKKLLQVSSDEAPTKKHRAQS